jgi:hypothetical protein
VYISNQKLRFVLCQWLVEFYLICNFCNSDSSVLGTMVLNPSRFSPLADVRHPEHCALVFQPFLNISIHLHTLVWKKALFPYSAHTGVCILALVAPFSHKKCTRELCCSLVQISCSKHGQDHQCDDMTRNQLQCFQLPHINDHQKKVQKRFWHPLYTRHHGCYSFYSYCQV